MMISNNCYTCHGKATLRSETISMNLTARDRHSLFEKFKRWTAVEKAKPSTTKTPPTTTITDLASSTAAPHTKTHK